MDNTNETNNNLQSFTNATVLDKTTTNRTVENTTATVILAETHEQPLIIVFLFGCCGLGGWFQLMGLFAFYFNCFS